MRENLAKDVRYPIKQDLPRQPRSLERVITYVSIPYSMLFIHAIYKNIELRSSNAHPETEPEKTESKEPPKRQFFPPAIISFSSNSEQVVLDDGFQVKAHDYQSAWYVF